MHSKLSKTQMRLLVALSEWECDHAYPPTRQELIELAGYKSRGCSQAAMYGLRNTGWVTWEEGKRRTLRVVRNGG